jgi:hypothetical protein
MHDDHRICVWEPRVNAWQYEVEVAPAEESASTSGPDEDKAPALKPTEDMDALCKNCWHTKFLHFGAKGWCVARGECTCENFQPLHDEDEAVDHPQHYGGADNPYEVIKVIEAWKLGFLLGNAIKYIGRSGKKNPDKRLEDLKKAAWYLNRQITQLEEKQ